MNTGLAVQYHLPPKPCMQHGELQWQRLLAEPHLRVQKIGDLVEGVGGASTAACQFAADPEPAGVRVLAPWTATTVP